MNCKCLKTVLRKIYGPKKDELNGNLRVLHNVKLRVLCKSPKFETRNFGSYNVLGNKRNACRIFLGNPLGKL
jgi:hypothetical protein